VSIARARKDYGVIIKTIDADLAQYEVDVNASHAERARIRSARLGWLSEDAESVAARYRAKSLDMLDLIRQFGVIVDWGSGELLPKTTEQFRAMLMRRTVPYWTEVAGSLRDAPTLQVA
jgi:N-methylhydantoinase B